MQVYSDLHDSCVPRKRYVRKMRIMPLQYTFLLFLTHLSTLMNSMLNTALV